MTMDWDRVARDKRLARAGGERVETDLPRKAAPAVRSVKKAEAAALRRTALQLANELRQAVIDARYVDARRRATRLRNTLQPLLSRAVDASPKAHWANRA
jgi:hypothetical protein